MQRDLAVGWQERHPCLPAGVDAVRSRAMGRGCNTRPGTCGPSSPQKSRIPNAGTVYCYTRISTTLIPKHNDILPQSHANRTHCKPRSESPCGNNGCNALKSKNFPCLSKLSIGPLAWYGTNSRVLKCHHERIMFLAHCVGRCANGQSYRILFPEGHSRGPDLIDVGEH